MWHLHTRSVYELNESEYASIQEVSKQDVT